MRKDDSNQQLCDRYFLEIKEEGAERSHIDDLAFQASVLRRAAVPVGRYFLIHLNREYVRAGELGIEQEPMAGCVCIYTGRSAQCSTFKYSHPDCAELLRARSRAYRQQQEEARDACGAACLPSRRCCRRHRTERHTNEPGPRTPDGRPIIDLEKIGEELGALTFPLYFLDYETFAPAIPMFSGYSPYSRIAFQFSLHMLRTPTGEPEHVEYLHEERSDPK